MDGRLAPENNYPGTTEQAPPSPQMHGALTGQAALDWLVDMAMEEQTPAWSWSYDAAETILDVDTLPMTGFDMLPEEPGLAEEPGIITDEPGIMTDGYESMGGALPTRSASFEQFEDGQSIWAGLAQLDRFLLQSGYDQSYKTYLRRKFVWCTDVRCGDELFPWQFDDGWEWPMGLAYTYGNVFDDLLRHHCTAARLPPLSPPSSLGARGPP